MHDYFIDGFDMQPKGMRGGYKAEWPMKNNIFLLQNIDHAHFSL